MPRRPTTDHGRTDTASLRLSNSGRSPSRRTAHRRRSPARCETPHLALGAGGACGTAPGSGGGSSHSYGVRTPGSISAPIRIRRPIDVRRWPRAPSLALRRSTSAPSRFPIGRTSPPMSLTRARRLASGRHQPASRPFRDGEIVCAFIVWCSIGWFVLTSRVTETRNRAADDRRCAVHIGWPPLARLTRDTDRLVNIGTRLPGRPVYTRRIRVSSRSSAPSSPRPVPCHQAS